MGGTRSDICAMPSKRPNARKKFADRAPSARKRRPNDGPPRPSRPKRATMKHPPRGDDESGEHPESGDRLQKVLAAAGIASRRECEQFILEGRVEVDRKVVTELGTRVDPQKQDIRVDGEALPHPKLVYFAINKPAGVVS